MRGIIQTSLVGAIALTQSIASAQWGPEVQEALASTPNTYEFKSQNGSGESSVSYSGQIFRQVLLDELASSMRHLSRGQSAGSAQEVLDALWSYVNFDMLAPKNAPGAVSGESFIDLSAKNTSGQITEFDQIFFGDITSNGKQILNKLAGNDNPLRHGSLKGWNEATPEALLRAFLQQTADNAATGSTFIVGSERITEAYITEDGLDLQQLAQKFLHGALSFAQAAEDYLSTDLGPAKGLNAANMVTGKAYTDLEHHWDEAFGYFGAARDYLSYSDAEIKSGVSHDSDGNGFINITSEKNFGQAVGAAKRDLGATLGNVDFTTDIFSAFLQGRHLITSQPKGYESAVRQLAKQLLLDWEKVISATVIHYINDTLEVMESLGATDYSFKKHAKVWSEMKGYALAFQFNPNSPLSIQKFEQLHDLLGARPTLLTDGPGAIDGYKAKLLEARDLLEEAYQFDSANVDKW